LDFPNETIDHIDNNPANNELSNLQILSLVENIKKAHADGIAYKTPKGTKVNFDTNGQSNGMAKLSNADVLKYRQLYSSGTSKNEIILLSHCSRHTVSNFLFGKTYKKVGEICVPRPYER
jgi:DNA invertase Pin-like site-specific DNA recombinase